MMPREVKGKGKRRGYASGVRLKRWLRKGVILGAKTFINHLTATRSRSQNHLCLRRLPGRRRLLDHTGSSILCIFGDP
eukprot:1146721-Pelagomonas_calceolata.AAC.3